MKPIEIIAQPILNELKSAIERGDNGNWQPPWRGAATGLPLRSNGEPYKGINTFLLAVSASLGGFSSRYWFTAKECKRRGWKVRPSEYHKNGGRGSTAVCFYKQYDKKNDDGETESFRVLRYYNVYNADQIDGETEQYLAKPETLPNVVTSAECLVVIDKVGVPYQLQGASAFYSPSRDTVTLPELARFESESGFNGTALHELIHATGHKSRLDRNLSGRFGDHAYATEELVAEFGATILCAALGFEYKLEHHASYLEHWYKALKSNPNVLTAAGAAAQKAADYVITAANMEVAA